MIDDQVARFLSLMTRDCTIIAKQHRDVARSFDALARTCRDALDLRPADLLPAGATQQGAASLRTPPISEDPFGPDLERSHD